MPQDSDSSSMEETQIMEGMPQDSDSSSMEGSQITEGMPQDSTNSSLKDSFTDSSSMEGSLTKEGSSSKDSFINRGSSKRSKTGSSSKDFFINSCSSKDFFITNCSSRASTVDSGTGSSYDTEGMRKLFNKDGTPSLDLNSILPRIASPQSQRCSDGLDYHGFPLGEDSQLL